MKKRMNPGRLTGIDEKLLYPYQHIHMLNGYSFPKDKDTFFKYMPLDRFVGCVAEGVFVFVSPMTWKDPFEKMFFNVDCSAHGYQTENIACLCVTEKSSTNEDASWKAYADYGEKAVRLSINRLLFLDLLDDFAEKNEYEVYIGRAQYGYEKKEIMSLSTPGTYEYDLFFPYPMERKHYLSVMTLKRSAFEYENEFRIFLVKDNITFDKGLLKIPCDYKLDGFVTDVMLAPYPVLPEGNDLVHSVRARMNKIESDELKRILHDLVGCRIRQSRLYDSYKRVEKVL